MQNRECKEKEMGGYKNHGGELRSSLDLYKEHLSSNICDGEEIKLRAERDLVRQKYANMDFMTL